MRIGVDMVRVSQLAHSLSISKELALRTFAPSERELAAKMPLRRSYEFLAGRFAVKEAVIKAMSSRLTDGVALRDVETVSTEGGFPEVRLYSFALSVSQSLGLSQWKVSISHENGLAIAVAIAD